MNAVPIDVVEDLSRVINLPDTEVYGELKKREVAYYSAIEKILADRRAQRDAAAAADPVMTLVSLGPQLTMAMKTAALKAYGAVTSGRYADLAEIGGQEEAAGGLLVALVGIWLIVLSA